MNIESEIKRLLDLALPLRSLDEDDPRKEPLGGIVDEINRLRAEQDKQAKTDPEQNAVVEGDDADTGKRTVLASDPHAASLRAKTDQQPNKADARNVSDAGAGGAGFRDPVGHTEKRKPGRPRKADK